jgi:hypothetical protein
MDVKSWNLRRVCTLGLNIEKCNSYVNGLIIMQYFTKCSMPAMHYAENSNKYYIEDGTVDSRYYDTDGLRKMYQYNQTIDITSLNFYCLAMVGIQI